MGLRTRDGVPIRARTKSCIDCPFLRSSVGKFPPERFGEAGKDVDISWGCHKAPVTGAGDATQICAGYLQSTDSEGHGAITLARARQLIPERRPDPSCFENIKAMVEAHCAPKESEST